MAGFELMSPAQLPYDRANELFGVDLKDEHWAWVLELCGSLLIALSAAAAAKSASGRDTGKA